MHGNINCMVRCWRGCDCSVSRTDRGPDLGPAGVVGAERVHVRLQMVQDRVVGENRAKRLPELVPAVAVGIRHRGGMSLRWAECDHKNKTKNRIDKKLRNKKQLCGKGNLLIQLLWTRRTSVCFMVYY